ncbi:hypothetical protein NP233_g6953 [Leucocoprinus birnbaumii]|uniref:Uncharacterized protein n=1 Tax=Leucocoprinus birnbaumii TaxID=56174 RepID=A0AAD5VR89_9AGAR|nr:hypothetical protein NP233_g6953 [Leucocoprinus birnbaumii]
MATQSILVEDCSPLIQYAPAGAWSDAQLNDTLATSYSGGSYHSTSIQGATATFQFSGTGFVITGGRRPGYGPFSISLDGQQLFNGNPAPGPSLIDPLASVSGLSNELHTVILTNTGGSPIDIDAITFNTTIGSSSTKPNVTIIDDSDSRILYSPSNAWGVNNRSDFQDGTLHFSQSPNATASLQFTGNAIAYYGTVAPDHADVAITIDNETVTMPSHSASDVLAVRPRILMWWADGLSDGEHTMTITKVQSDTTGPFVDVDSFVVYANDQAQPSGGSNPSTTHDSSPTNSHTGAIIGAVVAGTVALLLIIAGVFLFLRQRRQRRDPRITKSSISPVTPHSLCLLPAPLAPLRKPINYKRNSGLSIAPSYYGDPDFAGGNGSFERRSQTASGASDPSIPPVPRIAMARSPASPRSFPVSVAKDNTPSPSRSPRPSRPRRPPTLNIASD